MTNNTGNGIQDEITKLLENSNDSIPLRNDYLYNNSYLLSLFLITYFVIFCVGVLGNLLVCYIVVFKPTMRTVTNFFIFNLALADICLCLFCMMFTPMYYFLSTWIFGRALCHLVPLTMATSVYVSTFTLTAIAVDRYIVILYPFRPRMTTQLCLLIILCIWLLSCLLATPYTIWMSYSIHMGYYFCTESWPWETLKKMYGTINCIMQFVIPLCIISFSYARVSLRLRDRARARPGARSSKREEEDRERNRKTNRMLIAMVVIFGVSWLPLTCTNLVTDYYVVIADGKYYMLVFFISHLVAMSSTCYNPFLYAWLNENFRKEFKQVLPCCSSQSNDAPRTTASTRRRDTVVVGAAVNNPATQVTAVTPKTEQENNQPTNHPSALTVTYSTESEKIHLLNESNHSCINENNQVPTKEYTDTKTLE